MTSSVQHRRFAAREALLDAAERLFVARGYSAVSTRDLAEEASVNLAAIQYHFGSKGKLFVEAVRRLMSRKEHTGPFAALEGTHESPESAALTFAKFVQDFLRELANPTGPDVCRIIFREAFSETGEDPEMRDEIISSMVEGLHRPSFMRLLNVLRALAPNAEERDLELHAQSVIAQCTFYRTHEPFLCRLATCSIASASEQREVARHVASMTLLALGWSSADIESILRQAAAETSLRSEDRGGDAKSVLEETV